MDGILGSRAGSRREGGFRNSEGGEMDGSFACPECGCQVEVQGLAPGRQVRCGFCEQLVEVPFLPRVPAGAWKRQRFTQSRWFTGTVTAFGVILAGLVLFGGMRFVRTRFRAAEKGSIQKLFDSSRAQEESGKLGQALIDLDVALSLARKTDTTDPTFFEEQQRHRGELARRDAQAVLDQLAGTNPGPLSLGEWLNLIARASRDPDLLALRSAIDEQFRAKLKREADTELAIARSASESGRVVDSLRACDRIAKLLKHLPPEVERIVRRDTEDMVSRLIERHGVVIESSQGAFVYGSQESYRSTMLPILLKSLENKGYLPYRTSSPWAGHWLKAHYRLSYAVSEQLEGNYETSDNRLTRIEARLTLTSRAPRSGRPARHVGRKSPSPGDPPTSPAAWLPSETGPRKSSDCSIRTRETISRSRSLSPSATCLLANRQWALSSRIRDQAGRPIELTASAHSSLLTAYRVLDASQCTLPIAHCSGELASGGRFRLGSISGMWAPVPRRLTRRSFHARLREPGPSEEALGMALGESTQRGESELSDFLKRIQAGDESAARELLGRFEAEVRLVVRRQLPRLLRSRFDSLDFLQSVWGSFFRRMRTAPTEFEDSRHLVAFLARAAKNKVIDEYRRAASRKHDMHREEPLWGDGRRPNDLPDPIDSPSEVAQAHEVFVRLQELMPAERRTILEMKAEGLSSKDIGERLGISERTVQRVLEELRRRMESEWGTS